MKADNIYAFFHLFASEVPRFRIPGRRFRFREFPPAIKVVTDRYKVPGSSSITQRGTLTGAKQGGHGTSASSTRASGRWRTALYGWVAKTQLESLPSLALPRPVSLCVRHCIWA